MFNPTYHRLDFSNVCQQHVFHLLEQRFCFEIAMVLYSISFSLRDWVLTWSRISCLFVEASITTLSIVFMPTKFKKYNFFTLTSSLMLQWSHISCCLYYPIFDYLVKLSTPLQLVLDETVSASLTFYSICASPHPGVWMGTRVTLQWTSIPSRGKGGINTK